MTKKDKGIYSIAGVIVLIALAIWFVKTRQTADEVINSPNTQSGSNSPKAGSQSASGQASVWNGTLKTSDSAQKGNLMLMTKDHTIYIKTSRDFSALVDKEVDVSYQGSLENFSLGDITAAGQ